MKRNQSGQTIIALLIFMMLAILITSTSVMITVISSQTNNGYTSGELALQAAETGAENALLQLERDPTYAGETMNINSSTTATITVSGTTTRTITSLGTVAGIGTYKRTVVVTATNTANTFTVASWVESP
jgi:Tfp pilus assembly protein PilW